MATVSLKSINKWFDSSQVLYDISIDIEDKEFVVFVGPSGCGKTTLLRIVAGLEDVSSGEVEIDGIDVSSAHPIERGISMVFQSYALYPHLSVFENIAFPLRVAKTPKAKLQEMVMRAADILRLTDRLEHKPGQLSGGQRQRVAIGRSIVRQPKVFLFDEPLSNLDAALRGEMRVELSKLHKSLNATMIYVTHDQVEAMTLANRIAVMNHGKLLQFDKPQVIFDDPSSKFVAGFIGSPAMNLIDGRVENKKFISDGIKTSFDVDFEGEITLGVRPDKIHIVSDNETNNGSAKVYSVELTGEANLVTFKVNNQNLIVKTDKNTVYEIDSVLKLNFNKEDCYFFDINSEERLRI
jgi:multiple sugar transport system ATP-binding protein